MRPRKFPANYEELDNIREYVGAAAKKTGLDERGVYAVQLAVDEACSNIIEHAYHDEPDGVIECACATGPGEITISLRDWGQPFDPAAQPLPDVSLELDDRDIGGLGIFLMRKMMDEVEYTSLPGEGNWLVLRKRSVNWKPAASRRRKKMSVWRQLLELDEKVIGVQSWADQAGGILEVLNSLVEADALLWLDETHFRLPDWGDPIFASAPPTPLMAKAYAKDRVVRGKLPDEIVTALPISDPQKPLGVIQVSRQNGKAFSRNELELLKAFSSHVAFALSSSHRILIERWRLEQLELVRSVSAQLANITDVDELARRVTLQIQRTFKYYYVALFTLEKDEKRLHFRSSASALRRRKYKVSPTLQATLGEGLIGNAARFGEEILSNDVGQEPRFKQIESLPETQSEVAIPLKIEKQVLGVLDVQSDQLNAFHPNDLLVLRALADSISVAIESAQLFSNLRYHASQLAAITEVGRSISSILHVQELMQQVADILNKRFGYAHVHLFTVHPNRRQILYEAGSGARSSALEGYNISLDDPEGLIPWVSRSGKMIIAPDVSKEPRYRPSPLPPGNTMSEIVMPLVFGEQVVGVLDVQSERLNAFSKNDVALFEALGGYIASAIHNADLYSTEQWRRQTADSLREVAGLLSANASLEQVLDAILTELERNLPADILSIWFLDEEDIYCAAVHGAHQADLQYIHNHPQAALWLTRALLAREPILRLSPDDPMGPGALVLGFAPDHSSIAVPLRIGDQAVGVLSLSHHTPGRYGHEARAIITTFASYAAVAIENARLYASTQEQAYASAALLQVAEAVVSLTELNDILTAIVRVLPILVGVERAAFYIWDGEHDLFIPSQEYDIPEDAKPLIWRDQLSDEFPLLKMCIVEGMPVFSPETHFNPAEWQQIQPASLQEQQLMLQSEDRLLMAFPLLIKDIRFGVMLIEEAPGGRRFRARRIEILNGVAQQAALAIQNDLFEQEMRARERLELEVQLARQIQQTLMPDTLPRHAGWEFDSRWRTARQVGGDFFDVLTLPNNRLGMFIADVADKGMPAALFMVLTRTLLRAAVMNAASPAEVIQRINELLYPDTQQGMFVTAVYAELDLQTGVFSYTNAGHNPPLWMGAEGVQRLTKTGMALGVMENLQFEFCSIQLQPGDTVLFYTDGVTEAFDHDGEMFGDERLRILWEKERYSIIEALDAIEQSLDDFVGTGIFSDDVTMLAVKRME